MNQQLENQVECTTCTWNKMCVNQPTMTKEQMEEKIKLPDKESGEGKEEKGIFGGLLNVMMFAGKDTECRCCPVFISRLSQGPELTQKIKDIMRGS